MPHPGPSWQPQAHPARHPHEYIRGGTTKILTLFHPASGQVRLQSAERCTNAVLHPWLRKHLSAVLAELPAPAPVQDPAATRAAWEMWQAGLTLPFTLPEELPPLRLLLVWDNLTGHKTPSWCCGCAPMASCRCTRPWVAVGSTWPSRSSACSNAARLPGNIRTAPGRSAAGSSRRREAGMPSRRRLSGTANAGSDDGARPRTRSTGSAAPELVRASLSLSTEQRSQQNTRSDGRRPPRASDDLSDPLDSPLCSGGEASGVVDPPFRPML